MAVAITRTDLLARELRAAAAREKDATAARRMPAVALVLEWADRRTAAETCGMDRQTLQDWVHRYNAEGLEGLCDRRSAGPAPRLSREQKAELAQMVREGPDPAVDGVVRWRRVDLKRKIEARFGVVMHERTVGKQLCVFLGDAPTDSDFMRPSSTASSITLTASNSRGHPCAKPSPDWMTKCLKPDTRNTLPFGNASLVGG